MSIAIPRLLLKRNKFRRTYTLLNHREVEGVCSIRILGGFRSFACPTGHVDGARFARNRKITVVTVQRANSLVPECRLDGTLDQSRGIVDTP